MRRRDAAQLLVAVAVTLFLIGLMLLGSWLTGGH